MRSLYVKIKPAPADEPGAEGVVYHVFARRGVHPTDRSWFESHETFSTPGEALSYVNTLFEGLVADPLGFDPPAETPDATGGPNAAMASGEKPTVN